LPPLGCEGPAFTPILIHALPASSDHSQSHRFQFPCSDATISFKLCSKFWSVGLIYYYLTLLLAMLSDWVKSLCPTLHKIVHLGDVLPSQSHGVHSTGETKNLRQQKPKTNNKRTNCLSHDRKKHKMLNLNKRTKNKAIVDYTSPTLCTPVDRRCGLLPTCRMTTEPRT